MELPEWVKKFKTKGIEIRKRGKTYHAYKIKSKWNPQKKRSQKITEAYLGVVTPNGFYKPRKQGRLKGDYEYGNVCFLWKLAEESGLLDLLKEHYPYDWEQIICFIILRIVRPIALKSIHILFEKTYLCKRFKKTSMFPKSLSTLLGEIGTDFKTRHQLMVKLTQNGKYIIVDLTALLSYSKNITKLERGKNKDHLYIPQLNMLLLFSSDMKVPTYVRLLPGSVRDVSTIQNTVKMVNVKHCIFIGDRGFYSATNVKAIKSAKMSYLLPLKRNSSLIPKRLPESFDGVFSYNDRPIIYWKQKRRGQFLYFYEDKLLTKEEETTYLKLIEQGKKTIESYNKKRSKFGKIFFVSDLDENPETIYYLYKARAKIEKAFDVFKNLLEADKSHLQDDDKVEGYTFVNFLALYIYYLALNKLQEHELNKKYSVGDVVLELSKVKIYEYENGETMSEIPKRVRKIVEQLNIDFDLLRIDGRS